MRKLAGLFSAAALVVTVACGSTDTGITTAVKSKLAADDTVKAYQVDVDTDNGVVTLSGDVGTASQKEHAVMIARNTDGVRDVIDQLRVNPTAGTSGVMDDDDFDVDTNLDDKIERGVDRGVEEIKEGARETGRAIDDAVTDDDRR